jgi:DNA-binding PadR family transcriptional regulator
MDEFNADGLKDGLDFFILNLFSDGPLSVSEIRRRVKAIYTFLDLVAAARKGKQSPGLLAALQRLQREGWLKAGRRLAEQSDPEMVYSLTGFGEQRLKEEATRRGAIVSAFVEDDEPDRSFRKFLNRRRAPDGS